VVRPCNDGVVLLVFQGCDYQLPFQCFQMQQLLLLAPGCPNLAGPGSPAVGSAALALPASIPVVGLKKDMQ
jgi:hypothetical protein